MKIADKIQAEKFRFKGEQPVSQTHLKKEKFLILICGLPSTGKTTLAKKLARGLSQYILISQNEIRRKMGMRRMPKTQERVLRAIDRRTAQHLLAGQGVIFESVNRYSFRRHQMYGVASGCSRRVITLEIVCSEEMAKKRMRERPDGDKLLSDPKDPAVYDKLKELWENIEVDFKYPGEDHVAYWQFDSEKKELKKIIPRKGMGKVFWQIKKISRS